MTTRYQKIILRLLMAILWRLIYKNNFEKEQANLPNDIAWRNSYQDRHLKIIEEAKKELDK